ncbi:hypothetical protein GGR51DRAFT_522603 [Nemania sp. FL0031]|nr:hypothetical protein GGR51DRAFT_522603 [Nemania sp. FL0031]
MIMTNLAWAAILPSSLTIHVYYTCSTYIPSPPETSINVAICSASSELESLLVSNCYHLSIQDSAEPSLVLG